MGFPLSVPAQRAIAKLGADISKARRRRRMSQASLAQRSGVSVATLKRLENGEPRVAIEAVARVLQVLGEIDRLTHLLGTEEDQMGLALMDEQLPKRVRHTRSSGAL